MPGFKIAEAFVEIKGDKGKFSGTIRSAKKETSGFATSATKSLKKVAIGLAAISVAAAAAAVAIGVKLTKAIIAAGKATLLTAVKYDKLTRGLTAVAGGAEEAQRQMIRLRKVAELPGLSFEAVLQGSINLQAAELNARLAERSMLAFGNALVTVGRGAEELKRANLQITQIATKTRGFGADIRVLREIVPQVGPALRRAFDNKPIEELQITGIELIEGLIAELEKLPKAAGGIANSIENIGISFDLLKAEAGKALIPAVDKVLKGLTEVVETLTRILPHWKTYQDQVAQVFKNITVIGIQTTSVMLKAMGAIVASLARLVWEPLKAGLIIALAEGLKESITNLGPFFSLLKRIPGIGDDIEGALERAFKPLEDATDKFQAFIGERGMKKFGEAFGPELEKIIANASVAIDAFVKGLGSINTELLTLDTQAKKSSSGVETVTKAVDDSAVSLVTFKQHLGGVLLQWQKLTETMGTAQVNAMASAFRGLAAEIAAAFRAAQGQEPIDLPSAREFALTVDNYETMWGEITETEKTFISKSVSNRQRAWQGFTVGMQRTFTDTFANMLDTGKASWSQFASDLKRIFLRMLAEIAVSEAFAKIFGAGAGGGGGGTSAAAGSAAAAGGIPGLAVAAGIASFGIGKKIGSSGFAQEHPTLARLATAPFGLAGMLGFGKTAGPSSGGNRGRQPGGMPGGQPQGAMMAPASIVVNAIFPNADIEHLSQERIERAVRRQFVPAFKNMQKQGLIPMTR